MAAWLPQPQHSAHARPPQHFPIVCDDPSAWAAAQHALLTQAWPASRRAPPGAARAALLLAQSQQNPVAGAQASVVPSTLASSFLTLRPRVHGETPSSRSRRHLGATRAQGVWRAQPHGGWACIYSPGGLRATLAGGKPQLTLAVCV